MKKAGEPLHVQLDLSNYSVAVVNTTNTPHPGLSVLTDVYSLENKVLLHREEKKDVVADDAAEAFKLDLAPLMGDGVVFVKLQLRDESGQLASENFYWLGGSSASYRKLNRMGDALISATARVENGHVAVSLRNTATAAALATKLTLLQSDGTRLLPAYYSDNYISLLPGEGREITLEYPDGTGAMQIGIRGWNVISQTVPVK